MRPRVSTALLLSLLVMACDAESGDLGLLEPIVAQQADFKHGALPGDPPAAGGSDEPGAQITSFSVNFGALRPGTQRASVSGRTSAEAYAVGLRITDLGSGYWLKPVGSEDPANPGQFSFEYALDVSTEIEPGTHELAVVAFDKHGNPGRQSSARICVASTLPDNLNVCNPEREPPPTIASLSWNVDADVDLIVIAPDGTRYDRTNRQQRDGETTLVELDADGVSNCLVDGRRYENFIWHVPPESGTWLVYANLFDACGKAGVTFELSVYRSHDNGDGTYALHEQQKLHGQFVRAQQNGGAGSPLYLAPIEF